MSPAPAASLEIFYKRSHPEGIVDAQAHKKATSAALQVELRRQRVAPRREAGRHVGVVWRKVKGTAGEGSVVPSLWSEGKGRGRGEGSLGGDEGVEVRGRDGAASENPAVLRDG